MVKLTHFDINQITPFSIGFDRVFDRLVDYGTTYETGGFPPYNIRKTDDFKHVIELALAGFSKDEIEVVLTDGVLVIKSADNSLNSSSEIGLSIASILIKSSLRVS